MRIWPILGWGLGVWLAAGAEAAAGGGAPGPLWLVALAAGLRCGASTGMAVGCAAGASGAALAGTGVLVTIPLGMVGAWGVSLLPRWLSAQNLLIGMLAAAILTLPVAFTLLVAAHQPVGAAAMAAVARAGINAAWMAPIYGITLLATRRSGQRVQWV